MKRLVIATLLFAGACTEAAAQRVDSIANVMAFAKANEGRFVTEVKKPVPEFTVRSRPSAWNELNLSYLPKEGVAVSFPKILSMLMLDEACVSDGKVSGQTAFGRSASFEKLRCRQVRLVLDGSQELWNVECPDYPRDDGAAKAAPRHGCDALGGQRLALAMTPTQFRQSRDRGLMMEVSFTFSQDQTETVSELFAQTIDATISNPLQTRVVGYRLHGTLTGLRLLSHDGAVVLGAFRADEAGKLAPVP